MSEQNILNPSVNDELNPNYGPAPALPEMFPRSQARSGKPYARRSIERGHVIECAWNNRPMATYLKFRQWTAQYENGFFTYVDWETGRYYTVQIRGPIADPQRAGNNKYSWKATLEEIPGLPMYQYPTNWARDAVLYGVRDDFGVDRWKLVGLWAYRDDNLNTKTPNSCYNSSTIGNTAEFEFFGYGVRIWAPRGGDRGRHEVWLDGALVTTIDQYNAVGQPSAVLYTNANLKLGLHRLKFVVLAKNAAATGQNTLVDTIEVMR